MSSKAHLSIRLKALNLSRSGRSGVVHSRRSKPCGEERWQRQSVGACHMYRQERCADRRASQVSAIDEPRQTFSGIAPQREAREMALGAASAPSSATKSNAGDANNGSVTRPPVSVAAIALAAYPAVWRNEALHNIGACEKMRHDDRPVHHDF
jgi:hypothetical protein